MADAHRRVAVAERAARAGGAVARDAFRGELRVETKADKNDLVTEADKDAQRQVIATVREEFSNDAVVGEEAATPAGGPGADVEVHKSLPAGRDTWVVDPIDGTTNFAGGLRLWATSVAAVAGGGVVAGATYLPTVDDMYAAGDDGGSRNGSPLSVSEKTDPETFIAVPVGAFAREDGGAERFGACCAAAGRELGDLRRFGSMQATLAFVASGEIDATFDPDREAVWDTLAGVHLVRQAGGTVTDIEGEPWDPESEGLVASNGEAHEAVLAVARAASERTGPES